MRKFGIVAGAVCLLAASAWGQNIISARPGLVNYTEGDVQINGQQVRPKSNGTKLLDRGQVLDTTDGKAELLLTPGVFLRVGEHSAIRMISPDLDNTQIELQRGEALVEVTELFKGNQIQILDQGATTTLLKNGLYRFEQGQAVYVYDGKAQVRADDRKVELGKGKEALLSSAKLKTVSFNRKKDEQTDPLYRWSEVRSGYLAEANVASARTVAAGNSMSLWGGPGWYWNPFFSVYSFIPGDGILYSPFGFGFYSPWWVSYAPIYAYRPYPVGGGGVIAGRPMPPPRVIRPAIQARGGNSGGGGARSSGMASARSSAPVSAAPAARSSSSMGSSSGGGRMGGGGGGRR